MSKIHLRVNPKLAAKNDNDRHSWANIEILDVPTVEVEMYLEGQKSSIEMPTIILHQNRIYFRIGAPAVSFRQGAYNFLAQHAHLMTVFDMCGLALYANANTNSQYYDVYIGGGDLGSMTDLQQFSVIHQGIAGTWGVLAFDINSGLSERPELRCTFKVHDTAEQVLEIVGWPSLMRHLSSRSVAIPEAFLSSRIKQRSDLGEYIYR